MSTFNVQDFIHCSDRRNSLTIKSTGGTAYFMKILWEGAKKNEWQWGDGMPLSWSQLEDAIESWKESSSVVREL